MFQEITASKVPAKELQEVITLTVVDLPQTVQPLRTQATLETVLRRAAPLRVQLEMMVVMWPD